MKLLEETIRKKVLPPEDRYGLIRDAFMLAQSGYSSTVDTLNLVRAYVNEDSYIVWVEIASDLKTLDNLIFGQPFYNSYKVFCREIFAPIATGVFVKASFKDTKNLLINVGADTVVERSVTDVIGLLEQQEKGLQEKMRQAGEILEQLQERAMQIYNQVETAEE